MMIFDLTSVKVAILLGSIPDREEAESSNQFLQRCGATTTYLLPERHLPAADLKQKSITAFPLERANHTDFDALLLFADRLAADSLSANEAALDLVRSFTDSQKPVGAVSHAVKVLLSIGVAAGRLMSGDPSLGEQSEIIGTSCSGKPVAVERYFTTAISASAGFNEAFARLCSEHKAGSGASLHTD